MAVDKALLNFLMDYVSDHKQQLFERVLDWRTNHMTVVLENVYQPQNASAVLRTCECMGVQQAHFVTGKYGEFQTSTKVAVGSTKWLDIHEYEDTPSCLSALKAQGYRVVATSPKAKMTLNELPLSHKTAFLFGEELAGLAPASIEAADELITIPMFGFTESYNLSVSAALCMQSFLGRLHQSAVNWQLTEEEKDVIRLKWATRTTQHAEALIQYFEKNNPKVDE
ncbi:MAG: TrmH family RNA methyltransferase [Flammeovirgaceae bacterium]